MLKIIIFVCLFFANKIDSKFFQKASGFFPDFSPRKTENFYKTKFLEKDIKFQTYFLNQKVDQFSFTNKLEYKQRILVNTDYYIPYGPIFFYAGNEGDIGFMLEIASQFNAALVFAEHRYYGKSLPFGNQSYSNIENLGYLTSEQALADYSIVIQYLKSSYNKYFLKSPVIVFGGSYGGMLAAWMRIKYPSSVIGALAASAPIFQFTNLTDCGIFFKTTTKPFQRYDNCADNIRRSWIYINKLGSDVNGRKKITDVFKLCVPLKTPYDVAFLKGWLSNTWTDLAMMNYPYETNFMAKLPAWPVKEACKFLSEKYNDEKLLYGIASAINLYYNYSGNVKCFNTSDSGSSNLGDFGWWFQSCSEMVMPMCSNGIDDMFEKVDWNLEQFIVGCKNKFGVTTRPYFVLAQYGGKDLSGVSNIIFSNGELDPWSGGGVLKTSNPKLYPIYIKDGAHHLDLRFSNKNDPDSVIKARKQEVEIIKQWIKDYWSNLSN